MKKVDGLPPIHVTGAAGWYSEAKANMDTSPGEWWMLQSKDTRGAASVLRYRLAQKYGADGYEFAVRSSPPDADGNRKRGVFGRKLVTGA